MKFTVFHFLVLSGIVTFIMHINPSRLEAITLEKKTQRLECTPSAESTSAKGPSYSCWSPDKSYTAAVKILSSDAQHVLQNTPFQLLLFKDTNCLAVTTVDTISMHEIVRRKATDYLSINTGEQPLTKKKGALAVYAAQISGAPSSLLLTTLELPKTYRFLMHDAYTVPRTFAKRISLEKGTKKILLKRNRSTEDKHDRSKDNVGRT